LQLPASLTRLKECLTANAKVATVLDSIPASSDAVESVGRQMKQCQIKQFQKATSSNIS
jgi:hypothetical protein